MRGRRWDKGVNVNSRVYTALFGDTISQDNLSPSFQVETFIQLAMYDTLQDSVEFAIHANLKN